MKPGGGIEITYPDLAAGKEVEVVVDLDPIERSDIGASAARKRPIWEIALEIGSLVPESDWAKSDWAKVPTDLAESLDRYLYGVPKIEG